MGLGSRDLRFRGLGVESFGVSGFGLESLSRPWGIWFEATADLHSVLTSAPLNLHPKAERGNKFTFERGQKGGPSGSSSTSNLKSEF